MAETYREQSAESPRHGTFRESATGNQSGSGTWREESGAEGSRPPPPSEGSFGEGPGKTPMVPCLEGRFEYLGELASGGEGEVFRVRHGATTWVVKQYRPGIKPDPGVLERLREVRVGFSHDDWARDPDRRSVLWLEECGLDPDWKRFYEVQEYIEKGELQLAQWPTITLARALIDAVAGFHSIVGGPNRDVKPENLLVRDAALPVLVLADLGLARTLEHSRHWTTRGGSVPYMAPESLASDLVTPAQDWWSVGMIVAQASLGHHPFSGPNGEILSDRVISAGLAQRNVPGIDEIADPRIRLLCQGLLTRDAELRWGLPQIRQWQQNESPWTGWRESFDDGGARNTRPLTHTVYFAGVDYDSTTGLAAAFAAEPDKASRDLFGKNDLRLLADVRKMLKEADLSDALEQIDTYKSGPRLDRLLRVIADMDPDVQPLIAGHSMLPHDIFQVCGQIVATGTTTPDQIETLEWVWSRKRDVWRQWRHLPTMQTGKLASSLDTHIGQLDDGDLLARAGFSLGKAMRMLPDGSVQFEYPLKPQKKQSAEPGIVQQFFGWITGGDTDTGESEEIEPPDDSELMTAAELESYWKACKPLLNAWVIALSIDPLSVRAAIDGRLRQSFPGLQEVTWWRDLVASGDPVSAVLAVVTLPIAQAGEQARAARRRSQLQAQRDREEQARKQAARARIDTEERQWRAPLLARRRRIEDGKSMVFAGLGCLLGLVLIVIAFAGVGAGWGVLGFALLFLPAPVKGVKSMRLDSIDAQLGRPPRYSDPHFRWDATLGDWYPIRGNTK